MYKKGGIMLLRHKKSLIFNKLNKKSRQQRMNSDLTVHFSKNNYINMKIIYQVVAYV